MNEKNSPTATLDNIIIRELAEEEIPSIVNAFSAYLEEIEDIGEQELTFSEHNVKLFRLLVIESIKSYGIHPLVAQFGDKLIGFNFWIKLSGFEAKKEMAHALGTYVKQPFRNLGIGSALSKESFNYLKQKGVEKVYGKILSSRDTANKYTNDLQFDNESILCKTL
jgi:GNAT superfamily N-acetyltransferase